MAGQNRHVYWKSLQIPNFVMHGTGTTESLCQLYDKDTINRYILK